MERRSANIYASMGNKEEGPFTKRSNYGFTVIELVVVTAIIGILAALVFPVAAKALAAAKKTVCLSNLHQLGVACQMYASDYDEWLPCDYYACNSNTTHSRLVQQILPYTEEMDILYCPSSHKLERWMPDIVPTESNKTAGNIGYYYFSYDQVPSTVTPTKSNYSTWISWFFLPKWTEDNPRIMNMQWDPGCWLWSCAWCKLTRTEHGVTLHGYHRSSITISYLDGHAKFQGGKATNVFK